jgi:hypothetical protein
MIKEDEIREAVRSALRALGENETVEEMQDDDFSDLEESTGTEEANDEMYTNCVGENKSRFVPFEKNHLRENKLALNKALNNWAIKKRK